MNTEIAFPFHGVPNLGRETVGRIGKSETSSELDHMGRSPITPYSQKKNYGQKPGEHPGIYYLSFHGTPPVKLWLIPGTGNVEKPFDLKAEPQIIVQGPRHQMAGPDFVGIAEKYEELVPGVVNLTPKE